MELRIALAQINATVGDLPGNSAKILEYVQKAHDLGADIVCFPELAITGYPPEDLLLKPHFIQDNLKALESVAAQVKDIVCIVGFVDKDEFGLYNAAAVINKGKVLLKYHKMLLPNYGVFDEKRYFQAGNSAALFKLDNGAKKGPGFLAGINICEDIWHKDGPLGFQARAGAGLILNINASPYHAGKINQRRLLVCSQAKANRVFIAYTNLVGGQDELVFDGQSMIVSPDGKVVAQAEAFKEDLVVADIKVSACHCEEGKARRSNRISGIASGARRPRNDNLKVLQGIRFRINCGQDPKPKLVGKRIPALIATAEVYQALVLGLRDYVVKNGFKKVVIGLSGGIDSGLVAALSADALGRENVTGIFMPSRYSSEDSRVDARTLAENLGIRFLEVSIEQIYKIYLLVLDSHFSGYEKNIAEENLQARIRGNILMAFSNKFGWLVLTTGNKSEMSTGYATLYGDMAGGFAVIKDVPKVLVYDLCRYRNESGQVIPQRVLVKEPTAELKPNQKDSDSLPLYPVLDPILKGYIEENKDARQIEALGFDKDTVRKVMRMVDINEYKRRQSPPGIKITPLAFGKDRRMPITNRYRG